VQQVTEVVALTPPALTIWTASHVTVYLDTPEMVSPVQVSKQPIVTSSQKTTSARS